MTRARDDAKRNQRMVEHRERFPIICSRCGQTTPSGHYVPGEDVWICPQSAP